VFLDRFLADIFIRFVRSNKVDFASLFLNAGAHIQHHHMFDSEAYTGASRNPDWYSCARQAGVDPLLFVYGTYDRIVSDILSIPEVRVMITTGLSQCPNDQVVYQYRFKDHTAALSKLGICGVQVEPRMSRDFLVSLEDATLAAQAEEQLLKISCDGAPLFATERNGNGLFCQIQYRGPAEAFTSVEENGNVTDLSEDIVLVSIENGLHQTTGYHMDSAIPVIPGTKPSMPLKSIFQKIVDVFDGGASAPSSRKVL
jgi:hypothetical protein